MTGNPSPSEFRRSPSTLWLMVLISLAVHVAIAGTIVVVMGSSLSISIEQELRPRSVSLHPVTLSTFNLPPLKGNRDAGPGTGPGKGAAPIPSELIKKEEKKPADTQKQQPAKKEEPKVQKKQTVKTPDKKPEPKKSEPSEKKQAEKKEEKPATAEVSLGSLAAEPAEKKPEPVSEIERRELRSSRYSAADSANVSGGRVTQQVAIDGGGGGGGTPETFRNVLVSLIWEKWRPKPLPLGEVKEALVEFTLYSPPVPQGARNKNRPVSVIREIRIVESSGDYDFDMEAQNALRRLTTVPPLPEYIKEDELVVSCLFSYRGESNKKR
jgi:outer membrane biosynthesis protein TonB